MVHWNFGLAWIVFALAIALHVSDEATHDFLSLYNSNVLAIRGRLHVAFPPVFTLRSFIMTLGSAVILLFALSPFAFHGTHWIRVAALFVAIIAGLLNACWHIGGSILFRRWLPGVLTSPILLLTGGWLLCAAWAEAPAIFQAAPPFVPEGSTRTVSISVSSPARIRRSIISAAN